MGDRATLRQDLLQWLDAPLDLEDLTAANPYRTSNSRRPPIFRALL